MEPSSKRRRLAPKVADSPAQAAIAQQQNQAGAQSFQQDQQPNQHYAPQEAVVATQPERHDFEAFARHLQDAAMHIYNQTLRPHYTSVSVLLLRWEEDTSVEPDLLALEKVFRDRYKFQTDKWAIPTVPNPSIKLGVQMASFLDNARPDHLLIIYYAGHGYVGPDNQLFWASNTREDAAKLKWDGVRCLFEDAQSEILLLLDTCAIRDAPVAGSHGAKQAIAAYTPDQALADVGPRTFTACLADALHRLSGGRPFNTQRLYDEIMAVRQQDRSRAIAQLANGAGKPEKNPVFFTLTPAKGHGIVLVPLDAKASQLQSPPESAEADNKSWKSGRDDTRPLSAEEVADLTFDEARVLVCTTFVGDASPDMTFFTQWLQNTPPIASKITVQGMFLGPPTMLLISMPVSIWSIVQHDKVCCFLGYVSSHNMIHLYQRLVKSAENGTAGFEMPAERAPPPVPASLPAAIPTSGPAPTLTPMPVQPSGPAPIPASAPAPAPVSTPTPAQVPTTPYIPAPQLQTHPVSTTTPAHAPAPAPDPTPASAPVPVPAPITVPTVAQAPIPVDVVGGGSPLSGRRDQVNHFTESARRQEKPRPQVVASHATATAAFAPARMAPAQASTPAGNANHGGEESEMKQAAEQLKALSHTRHRSDETPSTLGRSSTRLAADSIAVRHGGDPVSSPETNESGFDDTYNGGGSEFNTPSSKTKPRRPLQKQTPKHETRCNHCTHPPFKDSSSLRKHIAAAHTRPFPCAFSFAGCTSTFGSKNEWKRHIASQHLCLQYYRCSSCPPSINEGKGNEFNRKDLFTQHLRRMHAPFAIKKSIAKSDSKLQMDWDNHLKQMQSSCLVTRRQPPQRSACPKADCQSVFEGPGSWDEWTEHVGRHMEKGEAPKMGVDQLLAQWALDEGIIRPDGNGFKLVTTLDDHMVTRNGNGEGNSTIGDGSSLMIVNENGNGHEDVNGDTAEKEATRRSSRDRTADRASETRPVASSEPPPPPPPPRRTNGTSSGPSNIKHGPGYGQAHTGRLRVELQHGDHVTGDLDDDPASIVVATTMPPRLQDMDDDMDLD